MANTKISADPAATTLSGSEILPVLQGGVNKRTTIQDIINDKDIPVFGRTGGVIDRLVDKNGDTASGVESVTTFSALPTPTGNNRRVIYVDDLKLYYQCDGTYWIPLNRSALYYKSMGTIIRVVAPAATFTAAAATNAAGAGKVRLTSAGVHGLTNAVCTIAGNPAYIYIAGSTNWPAGLYQIADVDAATTRIDIFATFVTAMENPTISLLGDDIIALSIPIHKLTPNSGLAYDLTTEFTGSTNTKRIKMFLDAGVIHNVPFNTLTTVQNRITGGINNMGATNIQRTLQLLTAFNGMGSNNDPVARLAVDTSVATTFKLVFVVNAANEYIELQSFKLHMVA